MYCTGHSEWKIELVIKMMLILKLNYNCPKCNKIEMNPSNLFVISMKHMYFSKWLTEWKKSWNLIKTGNVFILQGNVLPEVIFILYKSN